MRNLRQARDATLRVAEPDGGVATLLDDSPVCASTEEVLSGISGQWAVSARLGRFLARAITDRAMRNVLEFGAGTSSLVMARALSSVGGGRLTSIEQWPDWCAGPWARVEQTPGVDARMVVAQPRLTLSRVGPVCLYRSARAPIASRGPYQLVLVDAPSRFYGRDGALPLIHAHLAPGAWVVLDDAGREGERWTLFRWLRAYRGLRLLHFDAAFSRRGLAVLRYTGEPAKRVDPGSVLTGAIDAYQLWRGRRRGVRRP